jgi:putative phosphoesterase
MKVGIIADSHDNVPMIERACELFNAQGVEMVFHAGDFIAPFALNPLNDILQCDYRGVFGNNDGERIGLQKTAGGRLSPSPAEFAVGEWKVLLAHEMSILEGVAGGGHYRLVAYGHTHLPDVQVKDNTLLVNPGECGGWLKGRCTVAIVDLDTLEAEIIDL